MQEIIITKNEAGQRFDKFLLKYFKEAGSSFIYKMLRKKNIELNSKKATGNEKLNQGDSIKLFMADETIAKFRGIDITGKQQSGQDNSVSDEHIKVIADNIIYENENVIFINKPAGVLSQKASPTDIAINEMIISYLIHKNELTYKQLETFKPSICNRLDRNTTGLITFGKSLAGVQELSMGFKNRDFDKYYLAVVWGKVTETKTIEGYLMKNSSTNKVTITTRSTDNSEYIKTAYEPLKYSEIQLDGKSVVITLLKIKLITGKTHQIRAHLSSIGHGILGDDKYGNKQKNLYLKNKFGIKYQFLHSYELHFGELDSYDTLRELKGKAFTAKPGSIYETLFK